MSECILSNKELENATKLMKIAIEHFPIPKMYTKEEQEKLIDSLSKSLNRLKEDSNELDKIRENQYGEEIMEWIKNGDRPIHPSSWAE
jgi:hypothetical protein